MNTTVVMGYERSGAAVRLINQNNGYLELHYVAPGRASVSLGLFEDTCLADALDEFHAQVTAHKFLGTLGAA